MKRIKTLIILSFCLAKTYAQELPAVGSWISGDFNGDGKLDTAFIKQTLNTITQASTWEIFFSDNSIPNILLGCCRPTLINEGDLNQNKSIEISVFQAPEKGCNYTWTTYSYDQGNWRVLIPTFIIPNSCEIDIKKLEGTIFFRHGWIVIQ